MTPINNSPTNFFNLDSSISHPSDAQMNELQAASLSRWTEASSASSNTITSSKCPVKRKFSIPVESSYAESLSDPITSTTTPPSTPTSTPPPKHRHQMPDQLIKKKIFSKAALESSTELVKIKSILDTKSIIYEGTEHKLIFIPNKYGQHTQLCKVQSSTPLVSGKSNDDLFVKVFHEACLFEYGKKISSFISTSMIQRNEILTHNQEVLERRKSGNIINIVNVLNSKTITKDLFYIVEKLNEFTKPWESHTSIESFSERQLSILTQIGFFIDYALKSPSKISLDLKSDNLAIDQDGRLALIDFMEHNEGKPFAFHLRAKTCIVSLSFNNKQVLNYFLENYLRNPSFNDIYDQINFELRKDNLLYSKKNQ